MITYKHVFFYCYVNNTVKQLQYYSMRPYIFPGIPGTGPDPPLRVPRPLRPRRLAVFPTGDFDPVFDPFRIFAASFMAFPNLYPGLCLFWL